MLKRFDHLSTPSKDFTVKTSNGGILTIITILISLHLIYTVTVQSFSIRTVTRTFSNSTLHQPIEVEFDVKLHHVNCNLLHVDAQDTNSQTQSLHLDRHHHVFKRRVNKNGIPVGGRRKHKLGGTFTEEDHVGEHFGLERKPPPPPPENDDEIIDIEEEEEEEEEPLPSPPPEEICGDCYGAGEVGECCDTCDDVRRAYRRKGWTLKPSDDSVLQCKEERERGKDDGMKGEGCNIYGTVRLQAGGGNLHIAPGKSIEDIVGESGVGGDLTSLLQTAFQEYNVSHTINRLRFGSSFPGVSQQLDGQKRIVGDNHAMHQYYIQVVPTSYKYLSGRVTHSNQFSVTEHVRHVNPGSNRGLPGIFFFYEVSPLHVEFVEMRDGWLKWITELSCVIGGVVAFMKFVDGGIYIGGGRGRGLG